MKRFAVKLLCLLPALALLLAAVSPGLVSGEIMDYDIIIWAQRLIDEDILIGMAYNEQTEYMKTENSRYYEPEVLALGTSRVMQISGSYWHKGFYNAGGGVANIDEFVGFLDALGDSCRPELLIVALDSYFFNDSWNGTLNGAHVPAKKKDPSCVRTVRDMYESYEEGKWSLDQIFSTPYRFGLNGKVKNAGFKKDGTYYYGNVYADPASSHDYEFHSTFERIDRGRQRFEYASEIDPLAVEYLAELVEYCDRNGIKLVAFIPPYAPSVLERMKSRGEDYAYLDKIYPSCVGMFEEYGFELYDYTDVTPLGLDDSYFVDGFHGGVYAYNRMMLDMYERGSLLKDALDVEALEELYASRSSNLD